MSVVFFAAADVLTIDNRRRLYRADFHIAHTISYIAQTSIEFKLYHIQI